MKLIDFWRFNMAFICKEKVLVSVRTEIEQWLPLRVEEICKTRNISIPKFLYREPKR